MKKYVLSFKCFNFVMYLCNLFDQYIEKYLQKRLWKIVKFIFENRPFIGRNWTWNVHYDQNFDFEEKVIFSKKSRIPKNYVIIWDIVLGDKNWHPGASFKLILFLEKLKFENNFPEIWIFKKKLCFLACKMTLKAYSELKCRNILILSRMVLN